MHRRNSCQLLSIIINYYKEKSEEVRKAIAKKTKNFKLLKYIMENEKSDKIKRMIMRKYSHLLAKNIRAGGKK